MSRAPVSAAAVMSALDQKQTSSPEIAMSALPPKADIGWPMQVMAAIALE
jgi:hypothetical protein